MKIIGITRIRNEEVIIQDTMNHLASFCDEIYVYDDMSTDKTPEIVKAHPNLTHFIAGTFRHECRDHAETNERQAIFEVAKRNASPDDWFVYVDADERLEYDWEKLKTADFEVLRMKLFDFYITPDDVHLPYTQRKWLGPEYRQIKFAFKASHAEGFRGPGHREMYSIPGARINNDGFVKHYGKSISIEQWEETCKFYSSDYFSAQGWAYKQKWLARKGKAVHHGKSDFGWPLIQWHEKEIKGVPAGTPPPK